jgi:hypothetical protein
MDGIIVPPLTQSKYSPLHQFIHRGESYDEPARLYRVRLRSRSGEGGLEVNREGVEMEPKSRSGFQTYRRREV